MIRTIHYLCLAVLAGAVLTVLIANLTRQDWLFVVGATSLVGAIVTRMAMDAKATD